MRRHTLFAGAAIAGLIAMLLLSWPMFGALGDLRTARQARSALDAMAALPISTAPLTVTGDAIRAVDQTRAHATLASALRQPATQAGLLIERVAAAPAPTGLVAVDLGLSGPEKAVLAYSDAIERGRPSIRFARWRVRSVDTQNIRLEAKAVAAWQR